jgi:hypothetical protein
VALASMAIDEGRAASLVEGWSRMSRGG